MGKSKHSGKKRTSSELPRRSPGFLRRWGLWLLLLGLVSVYFGLGGNNWLCNNFAKSAILSHKLDSAESWLNWSEKLSSASAETLFLRSKIARLRGNMQEMETYLQSANKLGYDKKELQFQQDLANASIGRLDEEAEQRIQIALQRIPADLDDIAEAYANGLTTLSRFDDVINLLEVWGAVSPAQPKVPYRRARIHEYFHQPDEAIAQYKLALEKNPAFQKAAYHLARTLLQQRNPDEALKYYQQCNGDLPQIAAHVGIANCYRTQGDLEKARDTLLKVIEHSFEEIQTSFRSVDEQTDRFLAASELGCIETELGEFESAKKHLEVALEKFPLDSVGRYSYAVALRGLGLKEEAEANFARTRAAREALDEVSSLQEVLRQTPNDTATRMRIGKAVLEHESERAGIFWIQSIFAYDPNNLEAHQLLADYFSSKTNPSEEDRIQANYHRGFLNKK